MPAKIPTEDLLAELRRLSDDEPSTQRDCRKEGKHDPDTYQQRFGSWSDALEAAGYDTVAYGRSGSLSSDDVVERIHRATADLGHIPSSHDLGDLPYLNRRTVFNHFDSWDAALAAAGLDGERPTYCDECGHEFDTARGWKIHQAKVHGEDAPDIGLLDTIRDLADNKMPPTQRDMADSGPYSVDVYQQVYGSWPDALSAAGFDPSREAHNRVCREELLAELRRLADELGRPPRRDDLVEHSAYSDRPYYREFGSLIEAQKAADVGTTRAQPGEGARHSYEGAWDQARERALERDGYTCQDCGMGDKEHREHTGCGLHVHHRTPYREFDDPDSANKLSNLVTLCWRCHADRHAADA